MSCIFFSNFTGNTRVITQNALQTFQEEMAKVKKDPYKVIMRQTKLPITLLNETAKVLLYKLQDAHAKASRTCNENTFSASKIIL